MMLTCFLTELTSSKLSASPSGASDPQLILLADMNANHKQNLDPKKLLTLTNKAQKRRMHCCTMAGGLLVSFVTVER